MNETSTNMVNMGTYLTDTVVLWLLHQGRPLRQPPPKKLILFEASISKSENMEKKNMFPKFAIEHTPSHSTSIMLHML